MSALLLLSGAHRSDQHAHRLEKAAGRQYLPDRQSMRELYGRLRKLDDGLKPLSTTGLMELPVLALIGPSGDD